MILLTVMSLKILAQLKAHKVISEDIIDDRDFESGKDGKVF